MYIAWVSNDLLPPQPRPNVITVAWKKLDIVFFWAIETLHSNYSAPHKIGHCFSEILVFPLQIFKTCPCHPTPPHPKLALTTLQLYKKVIFKLETWLMARFKGLIEQSKVKKDTMGLNLIVPWSNNLLSSKVKVSNTLLHHHWHYPFAAVYIRNCHFLMCRFCWQWDSSKKNCSDFIKDCANLQMMLSHQSPVSNYRNSKSFHPKICRKCFGKYEYPVSLYFYKWLCFLLWEKKARTTCTRLYITRRS